MGATMFGATSVRPTEAPTKRRPQNLAFIFQEILTAIVRVRVNRQAVSDPRVFRDHMQSALKMAEKEAMKLSYDPEDIRSATFAMVAFLDESVLSSANPVFGDWSSMPLQEELFGHHIAGETFFENLDRLLGRPESQDVADLLEVHLLCLLLGYKGRYGSAGPEASRPYIDSAMEKIRRIRGPLTGLSPSWAVPEGSVSAARVDPWLGRLKILTLVAVCLALLLFVGFKLHLGSVVSGLHGLAIQNTP